MSFVKIPITSETIHNIDNLQPSISSGQDGNARWHFIAVLAGADVKTLDLAVHPAAMDLANARASFRRGDIVRIIGGTQQDLQRLLGIGGAILKQSKAHGKGSDCFTAAECSLCFLSSCRCSIHANRSVA